MPSPKTLNRSQREALLEDVLQLFLLFCKQEFDITLYPYQVRVAREALSTLFVEPRDLYVKIARQAGKTEVLTLLLKFLIVFYTAFFKQPLMSAIASPQGEQAKTDIDRVKKAIQLLRDRWDLVDKENNAATIRAYRRGKLCCEMFKFSLGHNTHNESKTLNLLVIEEAHLIDDQKRSDELDPMLASTGGPTWYVGVGCTRLCDFKKGCDQELPNSISVVVDVDEVIRDRRTVYEETKNPAHLDYEKAFERELTKKGKQNPAILRNYYLEDQVEEGNFVSRERLLSCARTGMEKNGRPVSTQNLFVGIDWARSSDSTWAAVVNDTNDVIDHFKYPHLPYMQQAEMIQSDLKAKGYLDRIQACYGDDTGAGGPMEILESKSSLPIGPDSYFKFSTQSKDELYLNFEQALYKEPTDPLRFSYPADHPLAAEFEEQMTQLIRDYIGDGEYLSVNHPDDPDAHDDAPDATALALLAAKNGFVGEIQFL